MRVHTLCCLLAVLLISSAFLGAQERAAGPVVVPAVRHDTSPPLRDLPRRFPVPSPNREIPNVVDFLPPGANRPGLSRDPLAPFGPVTSLAPAPAPIANFPGLSDDDNAATIGGRVVPPDTEGDVSPTHYVQMINLIFAVYDKNGSLVHGPRANNDIWQGFGGICETNNDGDPVVLYDHLADRWMFSQFAIFDSLFRSHQCIAVSATSDPAGPYHRYDFLVSPGTFNFADYPKLGLWGDGYYMTANEFNGLTGTPNGAFAYAFERDEMLNGNPAQMMTFGPLPCGTECFFSLQPSHLEGPAPAAGTSNTFVMAFDDTTWGSGGNPDGYRLWDFSVDWVTPSNSSFTSLGQVNAPDFDANLCNFGACVPQRDSTELLDTLSQFTMFRAQARQFADRQTMVVSHTVDLGGNRAGVRWAELENDGSGWTLGRTGTIGPNDGLHRWMGSAAMDSAGNIAVGYSVSSSGIYPEIRYTVIDPAGTASDEGLLHAGVGSQTASSNRWGDYSSMSVDPSDGCTFWYTQEYYDCDGPPPCDFDFETRIGSFQAPGCTGGEPVCGNGVVEEGEDCDDGNTVNGDCCAADCSFEAAGSSCEGAFFCTTGETCDGSGSCDPGSGTPVDCSDGVSCTDDSCDEDADLCVNAPNDANCDDGLFCNGAETCDPTNDCQAGTPVDCDDGVSCTDDSCNEGSDQCDNTTNDANCPDDGMFCNGTEFCDPASDCSSTGDPCMAGEVCDESTDTCEPSACDNDGVCEPGEDCNTCPNDCDSGSIGATCGNGLCEAGDGEDCLSCPQDCNGKQNGRPSGRFCCGDGDGQNPLPCSDPLCSSGSFSCTDTPQSGSFCCGDGACDLGGEDCNNCALDCTTQDPETSCNDGLDNDCNGLVDCGDGACTSEPICQDCSNEKGNKKCNDGLDNDCDGFIDGEDPDCQ